MKIAALFTCFNRKEKTINCLRSLHSITSDIDIYLVDDGSADGTSQAVANEFSQVNIIHGSGNLYWSRGMFTAWSEAIKGGYDYYLWLNDDITLYPFMLEELLSCNQLVGEDCVVSGLIENIDKSEIIYGGYDLNKRLVQPSEEPQNITFMNGNVVLVPKAVVEKIGIIDPRYHHDLGDVDYGLRAIRSGIKVISTRRAVGAGCNDRYCRVRCWNTDIITRFKRLYSPLGSNPRINFYYRNKNFGAVNATVYYLFLHILNALPDFVVAALWRDRYKNRYAKIDKHTETK